MIVKGMEMPRECESCYLVESTIFGISKCRVTKRIWDPDPGQPLRPNWCPLHPLPYKHGRLIDADELEDVFYSFHKSQSAGYVQDAETIVEAEVD